MSRTRFCVASSVTKCCLESFFGKQGSWSCSRCRCGFVCRLCPRATSDDPFLFSTGTPVADVLVASVVGCAQLLQGGCRTVDMVVCSMSGNGFIGSRSHLRCLMQHSLPFNSGWPYQRSCPLSSRSNNDCYGSCLRVAQYMDSNLFADFVSGLPILGWASYSLVMVQNFIGSAKD